MKTTTKILIGTLLAAIVGILMLFTFMRLFCEEDGKNIIKYLQGKQVETTIQASNAKVLTINWDSSKGYCAYLPIDLIVTKGNDSTATLICSEGLKKMLQIKTVGDSIQIEASYTEKVWKFVETIPAKLILPKNVNDFSTNCIHNTIIDGINADKFYAGGSYKMAVENCNFKRFEISTNYLDFKSGSADTLAIPNINEVYERNIASGVKVKVEELSGRGRDNAEFRVVKGECEKMIWKPKTPDAVLTVQLCEPSEVSIIK